jgi:hypothetical protein
MSLASTWSLVDLLFNQELVLNVLFIVESLLSYCIYYANVYPEIYDVVEFEWSDFSFDHYTKQFSFFI